VTVQVIDDCPLWGGNSNRSATSHTLRSVASLTALPAVSAPLAVVLADKHRPAGAVQSGTRRIAGLLLSSKTRTNVGFRNEVFSCLSPLIPHRLPHSSVVREPYRTVPGLGLTKPQAMRLFGVAPSVCAAMLRALVMEKYLSRTGDGLFVKSTTR
jgi:hypothetical protein